MLFYYIQIKDRHDPGVNIRGKATVASFNEAGGSNEHLDWLIIDLNAAKIIETINALKINANESTHTALLMLRVKQVTYETKI